MQHDEKENNKNFSDFSLLNFIKGKNIKNIFSV